MLRMPMRLSNLKCRTMANEWQGRATNVHRYDNNASAFSDGALSMGSVGQFGSQDTIGGMIFFGGHGSSGMVNGCQMHHMVDVLENGFEGSRGLV